MPKAQRDDTRSLILEVAETHFGAKGYSGTHLQSIPTEVGVQKAALYSYFDSKSAKIVNEDRVEYPCLVYRCKVNGINKWLGYSGEGDGFGFRF